MKFRHLFYEKLKNRLEKQRILQESLEGFIKKYTPVLKRLANEYPNLYFRKDVSNPNDMLVINDESITKIIRYIHSLDPTSKEQFAKSIMNIFLNTLTHFLTEIKKINNDKVEIVYFAQETRDIVKRYFNIIEHLKRDFKYSQNIKTLNQFERLEELKDYVRKLTDIAQELKLRKDSKGFKKMELVAETDEWEARACWDEDQMVNTFGGWSDWCIAKRRGWWEQYTGQEYLTQENARPGIPIVFKNKTSDRNANNQSIKFVCVILAYENEKFWEYRNRKDSDIYNDYNDRNEKDAGKQIKEMEKEIVDNLKKEYDASSIWTIGNEKFGDIDGGYKDEEDNYITTYNLNEYPNEDVEEVFGNIPIELENGSWEVDEINVSDGLKDKLFYDFLSEINGLSYDKIIEVYGNVFITHDDTPSSEYNLKLKIQHPSSIISIGSSVESLEIVKTKAFEELYFTEGYKEVELNNAKVKLVRVDSNDREQVFIDNFSTKTFKIWGSKDIAIKDGIIGAMEIDDFDGEITLQGKSEIELINCTSGDTFQILDCKRYNIFSNEKEITLTLNDSNDINKNKEQYIDTNSNYESIIFDIDDDQSGLIFTIDEGNKSLKNITLPSAEGVIIRMTKEMFDNLETIDGDEDKIEIIN